MLLPTYFSKQQILGLDICFHLSVSCAILFDVNYTLHVEHFPFLVPIVEYLVFKSQRGKNIIAMRDIARNLVNTRIDKKVIKERYNIHRFKTELC